MELSCYVSDELTCCLLSLQPDRTPRTTGGGGRAVGWGRLSEGVSEEVSMELGNDRMEQGKLGDVSGTFEAPTVWLSSR